MRGLRFYRRFIGAIFFSAALFFAARSNAAVYPAANAELGPNAEVVRAGEKGEGIVRKSDAPPLVSPRPETAPGLPTPDSPPDLLFTLKEKPGRYHIRTSASLDEAGHELRAKGRSKYDSFMLLISVDDAPASPRVVYSCWRNADPLVERLGVFAVGEGSRVRVWLPEHLTLHNIELIPYKPRAVPPEVAEYRPTILPPDERPRLWVTPALLPKIRESLTQGENAPVWEKLRAAAKKPFSFERPEGTTVGYNRALLRAAEGKAFVYLMTGEEDAGREAVSLARDYLAAVEFGNILDITREIGETIYVGSLVFDWCHPLLSDDDRALFQTHLMRLAESMEIGWPPFGQMIVNGHGSEAQVNRDLLSMAIALYGLDPVPWQYCSYRLLEELVPMRRFEYASPRHNQGISYAGFRFQWEMRAAMLLKRLAGKEVFDPNIKGLRDYFLYMRTPDGGMLRDGDSLCAGPYWAYPTLALLFSAYGNNNEFSAGGNEEERRNTFGWASDEVMKGELMRQGVGRVDPVLFLLLNDPALIAEPSLESLPLFRDFGAILPAQIIRTGWNIGPESDDIVVEFKGGGLYFANHQHSDAGSFQIFYRGYLAADLGQYHFYGTPYDVNFAKGSISHNVMLVYDPDEKFPAGRVNDGGQRRPSPSPKTPREAEDESRRFGRLRESWGRPDAKNPEISFCSWDLAPAYSDKVTDYVRSCVWLKTGVETTPIAVIIFDRIGARDPSFKKYWQMNSLSEPEKTGESAVRVLSVPTLPEKYQSKSGKRGQLLLVPLLPTPGDAALEWIGGERANSIFGERFAAPDPTPEATGWRIQISPNKPEKTDVFLNVLLIGEENADALPVSMKREEGAYRVMIGERSVTLSDDGRLMDISGFIFQAMGLKPSPSGETFQVLRLCVKM